VRGFSEIKMATISPAINSSQNNFYEFDSFGVDVERRLLLRDGVPVALMPKAFETLLALIGSGGRVMSKAEMMSVIWPDSYVEESNLAQNIFLLRRAFGEGKREHRYIVTIPGAGYRFIPRVRRAERKPARAGLAADEQAINSVAVLPFKPLCASEADRFLGLGIADALIRRLSGLKAIKVLPTAAVLRFAESTQDPWRDANLLGVDALLDGFYQRDGAQLRVSVQLFRTEDGITLWAAKFDEEFTNLFAVQDSVSEQVMTALSLKLFVGGGEERPPHLAVVRDTQETRLRRCL
jgi:DNA-binding winged helix-turn-helix (wHTH) protein